MRGTEKQINYANVLIDKYQRRIEKIDLDEDLAYLIGTIINAEKWEDADKIIEKIGVEEAKDIVKKYIDLGLQYLNAEEKSWEIINSLKYLTKEILTSVDVLGDIKKEMRKIEKELEELL